MAGRACGFRLAGEVYVETHLGPQGHPIEEFICDPPIPFDPSEVGVTPLGVRLVEHRGQMYLFDWIGSNHYPDPVYFLEEVRRMGLSRRVPRNLDFDRITSKLRLVLLHARACWDDATAIALLDQQVSDIGWSFRGHVCPQAIGSTHCPWRKAWQPHELTDDAERMIHNGHCARFWWQTVTNGLPEAPTDLLDRRVTVTHPSFTYRAFAPPMSPLIGLPLVGIIARFPISQVTVIRDPVGDRHEAAMTVARNAHIPVALEDA